MRALPIGFPKVMVSTLASGNTAQYVGSKDIVMFPSIVDVAGLNRISRQILTRAAGAICGMVEAKPPAVEDKPVVVASQFGNTTVCVDHARKLLEAAGYEVLVFHATGVGGRTMESIIESGMVAGVLDITTNYFEFVPEDEIKNPQPTVLGAHELQVGRNYYILLTTSYGLYRYNIHDVVRCTGYHNIVKSIAAGAKAMASAK